MSRFTREAYPVVVVASVGTSTADFGIDTDGNLILNQLTAASVSVPVTAAAFLTFKTPAGVIYRIPAFTTLA